jgi:hypothetical protein
MWRIVINVLKVCASSWSLAKVILKMHGQRNIKKRPWKELPWMMEITALEASHILLPALFAFSHFWCDFQSR